MSWCVMCVAELPWEQLNSHTGTSAPTGLRLCWSDKGGELENRVLGPASELAADYILHYPVDKPIQLSEQLDVIFLYVDVGQDSNSTVVFALKKVFIKRIFFLNLRTILAIYLDRHRKSIILY